MVIMYKYLINSLKIKETGKYFFRKSLEWRLHHNFSYIILFPAGNFEKSNTMTIKLLIYHKDLLPYTTGKL